MQTLLLSPPSFLLPLHSLPLQINWFGLAIIDSHLTQPGIHEQRQRAAGQEPYHGSVPASAFAASA